MEQAVNYIQFYCGAFTPLVLVALFLFSSFLIIWRLEILSSRGVSGCILGTIFLPYFSGLSNMLLVFITLRDGSDSSQITINCIVNNLTNATLLLAIPAILWGLDLRFFMYGHESLKKSMEVSTLKRLSLKLTMLAMIFFSGAVWFLGNDGVLDRNDGAVLIGMFLFWQAFHIYEVLKDSAKGAEPWGIGVVMDLIIILIGSGITLICVDGIVAAIISSDIKGVGSETLGLITGWLMVLPNALLAFYYAAKRQPDVVYSSQIGDGHICIPFCLGLFAFCRDLPVSDSASMGLLSIIGCAVVHLYCVLMHQRLPIPIAVGLIGYYAFYLYGNVNL